MENASFISLGKFVDNYCAHTFNDSQRFYDNYLVIAQHFYGELQRTTLKVFRKKKVKVDQGLQIAYIPGDAHRILAVYIIDDCKHEQPLHLDQYYDTTSAYHNKGCGCKKCDCTSSACGSVNNIAYEEEDVMVYNDVMFKKVTKTKVQSNGDLVKEITMPYLQKNGNANTVIYKTTTERVANLDIKPCGCIVESQANINKCISECGITVCGEQKCDTVIELPHNHHGRYTIDEMKGVIHLIGVNAGEVVIKYVSNGADCDAETMVDIESVETLLNALYFGSIRFSLNVSRVEKLHAEKSYERAKQNLIEHRNPIDPSRLLEIQNTYFVW